MTRWRWRWLILVPVVLLGSGWAAREGWAVWQERSARRALDDDHLDEARRHVEQALRIHPGRLSTNLLAARIARLRGAYADAARHLDRCGRPGDMSEPVQIEWLLLRCQQGKVDEHSAALLACVDRDHPESDAILEALAAVYMRQTRYPEARHCLDRWVEHAPDSVRALAWRGWVYNQLERRDEALADYEHLLSLHPDQSTVRLRMAEILVESLKYPEARPHLEQLHAEQPTNPDILVLLGRCRVAEARTDEARALYEKALEVNPDHVEALLRRGQLELDERHYAEAERWLRQALQRAPQDVDARYALHRTLQAQPGRQREAKQELARWEQDRKVRDRLTRLLRTEVDRHPKDPDLAREVGELFLQRGQDRLGVYWLERALKLDPRHAASHRALMNYYERTNNPKRAAEHRKQLEAGK
jgi:Tfp pilus assembly protein PilF